MFMKKIIEMSLIFILGLISIIPNQNIYSKDKKIKSQKEYQKKLTDKPKDRIYDDSTGMVTYETHYKGKSGSIKLYWKEYGKKEARYSSVSMTFNGKTIEIINADIKLDSSLYSFEKESNIGTSKKTIKPIGGFQGDFDTSSFSKEILEKNQYQFLGNHEQVGKMCNGFTMTINGKTLEGWNWNGLMIYSGTKIGQDRITEIIAKEIQTNIELDNEIFTVPNNIKFTPVY